MIPPKTQTKGNLNDRSTLTDTLDEYKGRGACTLALMTTGPKDTKNEPTDSSALRLGFVEGVNDMDLQYNDKTEKFRSEDIYLNITDDKVGKSTFQETEEDERTYNLDGERLLQGDRSLDYSFITEGNTKDDSEVSGDYVALELNEFSDKASALAEKSYGFFERSYKDDNSEYSKNEIQLETSLNDLSETDAVLFSQGVEHDNFESTILSYDCSTQNNLNLTMRRYLSIGDQDIGYFGGNRLAKYELDDESFIQEMEITKIVERSAECVCNCHCRRNFQQNGHTKQRGFRRKNRSHSLPHNLESSSRGVIKTTETDLTNTAFRTRLKSVSLSEVSAVNLTKGFRLRCKNVFCVRIKEDMAKVIFYCVIFVLLCLCGGVLMMHKSSEESDTNSDGNSIYVPLKDSKQDKLTTVTDSSILLDRPFVSVPRNEFEKHLSKSKSAAEMLKIFFGDPSLSEDQVNILLHMKSHQVISGPDGAPAVEPSIQGEESYESKYRELAYQQYLEIERSPTAACHVPVPEIEIVEDTYSDAVRHFLPSCTIVHRCRNTTGCCPRGSVCAPKRENGIELIERFFLVLEAVPGTDTLRPAKDLVAAKTFINHTACECQMIDVETNCHKECPNSFTKQRPGADCECVCMPGHKKCQRIHKGLHPLDEKDLECLKEGKCLLPTCEGGEFNISTGFCPHFRRWRRDRSRK